MFAMNYIIISRKYPGWLREIAPPQKVIFLTRSNLIEHAVSYSRAIRSQVWFAAGANAHKPIDYDGNHIAKCAESICFQLEFWSELFALTGAQVCHVTYEDFLADLRGTIARVAEFIGVPLNPRRVIGGPLIRMQRDEHSAEWVRRYEAETVVSGGSVPPASDAGHRFVEVSGNSVSERQ